MAAMPRPTTAPPISPLSGMLRDDASASPNVVDPIAMNSERIVSVVSKALGRLGSNASMAMKCVLQIEAPVATPARNSQPQRIDPALARARTNSRIAIHDPTTHMSAARRTSLKLCSPVRQATTRNIIGVLLCPSGYPGWLNILCAPQCGISRKVRLAWLRCAQRVSP